MKFATILFAALGLLASSVAAAPTETTIEIDTRDVQVEMQDLQLRFDDHPIMQHYFGHPARLNVTEADYAPGAPGTVEIEKRGGIATIAKLVVKGVMAIVNLIKGKIEADKQMRSQWTGDMIGKFRAKYPHYNFVICHTDHKTDFKGKQGKDWGHSHQELPVSFHKTVGYEIYWFREGTFHRYGDGGWLNWSFSGNVKSRTNEGKDVVFGRL
ncbi:ectomycorrhiza-regulated small secreted protein [Pholiota molesta]|nr:ectomycorrhiza-regulated small secreted protein [Pholiota molesta]